MSEATGPRVRPSGHHRRHPGLGLVLRAENPEAHPAGVPARSCPPEAGPPHAAAGPPCGFVPYRQEEADAPGSH